MAPIRCHLEANPKAGARAEEGARESGQVEAVPGAHSRRPFPVGASAFSSWPFLGRPSPSSQPTSPGASRACAPRAGAKIRHPKRVRASAQRRRRRFHDNSPACPPARLSGRRPSELAPAFHLRRVSSTQFVNGHSSVCVCVCVRVRVCGRAPRQWASAKLARPWRFAAAAAAESGRPDRTEGRARTRNSQARKLAGAPNSSLLLLLLCQSDGRAPLGPGGKIRAARLLRALGPELKRTERLEEVRAGQPANLAAGRQSSGLILARWRMGERRSERKRKRRGHKKEELAERLTKPQIAAKTTKTNQPKRETQASRWAAGAPWTRRTIKRACSCTRDSRA